MPSASPVPVLLYHSISARPSDKVRDFAVTPQRFAEHMSAVLRSGRRPVTVGQFMESLASPNPDTNVAMVTFDDGFRDFQDTALPLLLDAGIPPTLYVTTGWLDDVDGGPRSRGPADPMLRSSDLPALRAAGVEIGAHSHTHPMMDIVDRQVAWDELSRSKSLLEGFLGAPVESFAYPHGFQSPTLRRQAQKAGYRWAVGVRNEFSCQGVNHFNVARLMVMAHTPTSRVEQWLSGAGARVAGPADRFRTTAYRAARRTRARLGGPTTEW